MGLSLSLRVVITVLVVPVLKQRRVEVESVQGMADHTEVTVLSVCNTPRLILSPSLPSWIHCK